MTGSEAKKVRESLGLTQQGLAERIGLSVGCVARSEQAAETSNLYRVIMESLREAK